MTRLDNQQFLQRQQANTTRRNASYREIFQLPTPLVQFQNEKRLTSQPEALLDEGFPEQEL